MKPWLLICLTLLCGHAYPQKPVREVTLLYTNDIESVYEPIEAFWRDDIHRMGGIPNVAAQLNRLRSREGVFFTLDAGDIFTGALSKVTLGRLPFDLYSAMGYDAVNLGNHEFEYGWRVLREVMPRARFPVLGANIFFSETDVSFAQPYAILEKQGIRVGVIGTMGVDAFINTMMPNNRQGLRVEKPVQVIQPLVDSIREEVDLVVVLTHQNRTAPMQTNKEADPQVQRGIDEDYELAGLLRGVDMIIGGHSDNGLHQPVVHPESGIPIGMTFGQGMHVGSATFRLDPVPTMISARLIPVDADKLTADPVTSGLIQSVRAKYPELAQVVGHLDRQAPRLYYQESHLGNLLADFLRSWAKVDIGLVPAGAIRADLEAGPVTRENILNVFPFKDTLTVVQVTGGDVIKLLEKSLSLEYGFAQYSGLQVWLRGQAIERIEIGGMPLVEDKVYSLATGSFTASGGENYQILARSPQSVSTTLVSDAFVEMLGLQERHRVPDVGRFLQQE